MPAFDGTGPAGQGSMTGRGMGPCANQGASRRNRFGQRGLQRGQGCFGCPWRMNADVPTNLEEEEKALEAELEIVRKARKNAQKK
ncbi:MAG: DUF5320 domain-containing protein [Candidatus Peribacteraceae bacterium]